jgi:hypothetical protein
MPEDRGASRQDRDRGEQLRLLGLRVFAIAVLVLLSWQLFQSLRRMAVRMRGGRWVCRYHDPNSSGVLFLFSVG